MDETMMRIPLAKRPTGTARPCLATAPDGEALPPGWRSDRQRGPLLLQASSRVKPKSQGGAWACQPPWARGGALGCPEWRPRGSPQRVIPSTRRAPAAWALPRGAFGFPMTRPSSPSSVLYPQPTRGLSSACGILPGEYQRWWLACRCPPGESPSVCPPDQPFVHAASSSLASRMALAAGPCRIIPPAKASRPYRQHTSSSFPLTPRRREPKVMVAIRAGSGRGAMTRSRSCSGSKS